MKKPSYFQRLFRPELLLIERDAKMAALEQRVEFLEERLLSYYKNRWDVIDKLADYLVGTQIEGDYLEFGVFMGKTFSYAYKVMAPLFPEMRFVALDSFEGLPKPKGIDAADDYTSGFYAGQFACDLETFQKNLCVAGVDLHRVITVQGWFDQSLTRGNPRNAGIAKVAAAWIDCDLYESTVPVLDFLTDRLSVGSVLLFDDWRCYRNLSDFGQQRACREWLERNPHIKLNSFVDFGFHGQAFTVASCQESGT
jgi:O-methyltransferase